MAVSSLEPRTNESESECSESPLVLVLGLLVLSKMNKEEETIFPLNWKTLAKGCVYHNLQLICYSMATKVHFAAKQTAKIYPLLSRPSQRVLYFKYF